MASLQNFFIWSESNGFDGSSPREALRSGPLGMKAPLGKLSLVWSPDYIMSIHKEHLRNGSFEAGETALWLRILPDLPYGIQIYTQEKSNKKYS